MDLLIGIFWLIAGTICVFKPDLIYQAKKLNPAQIARNNLICKRCGIGLIILSVGLIWITLSM